MTEKITQVRIGAKLIGLRGLEEVFGAVRSGPWGSPQQAQEEILRRVAAQNYVPPGSREEYRRALWREFRRLQGEEVEAEAPAGLEIKVLGLGCSGCRHFYQQVMEILAARGLAAELQYITDPALLQGYGIRTFPALIINGRVVVAGKVPPAAELEKILTEAGSRLNRRGQEDNQGKSSLRDESSSPGRWRPALPCRPRCRKWPAPGPCGRGRP